MKPALMGALLLLACTPALAADIAAGKAKTAMCVACHGKEGVAPVAIYPNLAGQQEKYLALAMKAYKNKQRSGGQAPVMYAMVAALSDADMDNIAAYYASLE